MLQDYLTRQAQVRGSAVAFVDGARSLSYGELEAESNRLAHLLHELGCGRGDRVCLLMNRSIEAVIAMLAVLKSGACYVPIDPGAPAARSRRVIDAVQPAAVLLAAAAGGQIADLQRCGALSPRTPLVCLDACSEPLSRLGVRHDAGDIAQRSSDGLAGCGAPGDAAYIMFTSGSTGIPKGPVISHANVQAFIDWAVRHFDVRPEDRQSWQPPLQFDLSTLDVYGGLAGGAEVHLVPPGTLLPRQILDFINRHELTQWFSVPSAMAYANRARVRPGELAGLRRVLWCGEVMPLGVLRDWMDRAPQARFTNLYGPTETTVASTYFTVASRPRPEDPPIPIGYPCGGEEVLVLGPGLEPCASGVTGEICIAGAGVGQGYWRDETRTAAAFRPDPRPDRPGQRLYRTGDLGRLAADGCVTFLGRQDTQIKSRGYRIELGEIEAALGRLGEIAESAVVALDLGGFEGTTIGCAFSPHGEDPVDLAAVRAGLAGQLPAYMIPTRWLVRDELPKNGNGKIDRRRLAAELSGGD